MKIRGLQKFTLLDYPDKMACTIFLYGCNFKCGFCHNPELVIRDTNPKIEEDEIMNFLKKRKEQLDAVCITGGEPLLTLEKNFLKKIKELGYEIKLDTNGTFPKKLKELIEERLIDYIAMDIKTDRENYEKLTKNSSIDKVEESIKIIASSNLNYEFRTTIVPGIHEEKNIEEMGKWIISLLGMKPENYFLQGFKNYGKFIDEKYSLIENEKLERLEKFKEIAEKYFVKVGVRY